jgi:hypothetical protein
LKNCRVGFFFLQASSPHQTAAAEKNLLTFKNIIFIEARLRILAVFFSCEELKIDRSFLFTA